MKPSLYCKYCINHNNHNEIPDQNDLDLTMELASLMCDGTVFLVNGSNMTLVYLRFLLRQHS